MHRKEKKSKKRLNKSNCHFYSSKKLSHPIVPTFTLFKSVTNHHRSPTNFMRRSQGVEDKQGRNEECRRRLDLRRENEYGLIKDEEEKIQSGKNFNGKNVHSASADTHSKQDLRFHRKKEDSKPKPNFREIRAGIRSPVSRARNPMKESSSTDHTIGWDQNNGCIDRIDSVSNPYQEEIAELNKAILSLSHSASQYQNLYERSQTKLESIEKEVMEEKVKQERIKNIYRERINQLARNREIGKHSFGHIFTYQQFPKDFVPEQIIIENSIDCSSSDLKEGYPNENCSSISNLSIESH